MYNSINNNKHHFDSTSLHAIQNPQVTNCCLCTCCHKPDILRKQCVIFNIQRYNMSNQMVSQALSSRISIPTAKEFICKKCDKSLRFGQMPMDAEVSYNYKHLNKANPVFPTKLRLEIKHTSLIGQDMVRTFWQMRLFPVTL